MNAYYCRQNYQIMLGLTLTTLTSLLADYMKRSFRLNDDVVSLQPVLESHKTQPDSKIHLFLANIERETAGGLRFGQEAVSDMYYKKGSPVWQLNGYIVLAAVFPEKQYAESLQLLSGVFSFLQGNNNFLLPQTDARLALEPVNLSFHELSNLWSIHGGAYYPSVICKIRSLNIDAAEIQYMERAVRGVEG